MRMAVLHCVNTPWSLSTEDLFIIAEKGITGISG